MNNPQLGAQLEIRTTGAEVLVHDPVHGRVHILNRWVHSPAQIAQLLSITFGADLQMAGHDVDSALHEFAALKLLEAGDPQ